MDRSFTEHGFLPVAEPLREFPHDSSLAVLDEIGHDLPSLLYDSGFRESARRLEIPALVQVNLAGEASKGGVAPEDIAAYLAYDVRGLSTMPPVSRGLVMVHSPDGATSAMG